MGEEQLLSLTRRSSVLAAFPNFAQYAPRKHGKSCRCNRAARNAKERQRSLTGIRNALKGLTPEQQTKFKQLFGASQIVFFHRGPHGPERVSF